jgi:site-specific DNA recombinase
LWRASRSEAYAIARQIAECNRKLVQYRAALDAGASPVTVSAWIAETEAERARCEAVLSHVASTARKPMTQAEIKSIVDKLASVARVLADASPTDKSEIFRQLGLKLTYHPGRGIVKAQAQPVKRGFFESVRGPRPTNWV